MTAMSGTRICCICDQPIEGEAEKIPVFSASGARPDRHRHPAGDPECRPRR